MKRKLLMTLVLVSFVFTACGNNDENSTVELDETIENENSEGEASTENIDDEGSIPEKPETLTMWVHDENVQLDAYEKITAEFTEEYGIDVDITPYSMADQLEGLSLDGPQGLGPDLFYSPHDHMGNIHVQGLALELDLTEDQQSRLDAYQEEAVTSFSYDGIQYGIPAVVETYVLFRNTDIIPNAPETVDEMIEMGRENTNEDQFGFLVSAMDFYFTYPFLTGPGGYVFAQDEDGIYDTSDIGLATDGAVEGAEMIQSWYDEGIIPSGLTMDVLNGTFMSGDVGMAVTGPWAIADYRDALGDSLDISPLPTWDGNRLTSFSGNKGWLVNYYTEKPYWSTELALYITNAENGELYFDMANELPAHGDSVIEDEFMSPVLEQIQAAKPMPNVPEMAQVWEPMGDALNFISQGEDPREVLEEAVDQIEANIEMMEN